MMRRKSKTLLPTGALAAVVAAVLYFTATVTIWSSNTNTNVRTPGATPAPTTSAAPKGQNQTRVPAPLAPRWDPPEIAGINDGRTNICPYDESTANPLSAPASFVEAKQQGYFLHVPKYVAPTITPSNTNARKTAGIPRRLFTLSHTPALPHGLATSCHTWAAHNPEYEVLLLDMSDMADYVDDLSDTKIRQTFYALQHPDLQVAFFRWVYLYYEGGIYFDARIRAATPLESVVNPSDTILAMRSDSRSSGDDSLFGAAKKHEVVEEIIRRAVGTVLGERQVTTVSQIAGGELAFDVLASHYSVAIRHEVGRVGVGVQIVLLHDSVKKCSTHAIRMDLEEPPFAVLGYPGMAFEAKWLAAGKPTVDELWQQGALYPKQARVTNAPLNGCPFNVLDSYKPGTESSTGLPTVILVDEVTPAATTPAAQTKIPHLMMQTWKDTLVPSGLQSAIQQNIGKNPDYEHRFYSDAAARKFIAEHLGNSYVRAFDAIVPGSFKSDIFRYAWLYVNGGVYIDTDQVPQAPLSEIIDPEDEFLVAAEEGSLYNGFIACTPKHPILKELLEDTYKQISSRQYGDEPDSVTGNGALRRAFKKAMSGATPTANKKYANGIRLGHIDRSKKECAIHPILFNEQVAFYTHYAEYRDDKAFIEEESHEKLWHARKMYHAATADELEVKELPTDDLQIAASCPLKLSEETSALMKQQKTPLNSRYILQVPRLMVNNKPALISLGDANLTTIMAAVTNATDDDTATGIPKLILQSAPSSALPPGMYQAISVVRDVHDTWTHVFFDLELMREYLQKFHNGDTLRAFDSLVPWVYKEDFFRYVFLHDHGGVYVQSRMVAIDPLSAVLTSDDQLVLAADAKGKTVFGGFLAAARGHAILQHLVKDVKASVLQKSYAGDKNTLTGAGAVRKAFIDVVGEEPIPLQTMHKKTVRVLNHQRPDGCAIGELRWDASFYLFFTAYRNFMAEMSWFAKQPHHGDFWGNRTVYADIATQQSTPRPAPTAEVEPDSQ